MQEFGHHIAWLQEVVTALDEIAEGKKQVAQVRSILEDGVFLCKRILDPDQNQDSELATHTLSRIQTLLGTPSASVIPQADTPRTAPSESPAGARLDTKDLITGEPVINIPLRPVSAEIDSFILNGLANAFIQTKNGSTTDISNLVESYLEHGQCPGFLELLTADERSRLRKADHDLCRKCAVQMVRLQLGDKVRLNTPRITRGFQTHIQPLLAEIRSEDMRSGAENILKLWERNLSNPYANFHYITMHPNQDGIHAQMDYMIPLLRQNPAHFSLGLLENARVSEGVCAGYDPRLRVLVSPEFPETPDFMDALFLFHELAHTVQDCRFLKKCTDANGGDIADAQRLRTEHMTFRHGQTYAIVEEECEAYGYMIELLAAKLGMGTHNHRETADKLGINFSSTKKMEMLSQLLQWGRPYFVEPKASGEVYSRTYQALIEAHCRKTASKVFCLSPEGKIVEKPL